jgi:hypothetical protein
MNCVVPLPLRRCAPLIVGFALTALAVGCHPSPVQIRLDDVVVDIRSVELTDRLPKDCEARSAGCNVAKDGYMILQIVVVPHVPAPAKDEQGDLDLFKKSEQAVIVASDGSSHERWMAGSSFDGEDQATEYQVAFVVPASSTSFELRWPGNAPIPLDATRAPEPARR